MRWTYARPDLLAAANWFYSHMDETLAEALAPGKQHTKAAARDAGRRFLPARPSGFRQPGWVSPAMRPPPRRRGVRCATAGDLHDDDKVAADASRTRLTPQDF